MAVKGGALARLDLSLKLSPGQEEVRLAAARDPAGRRAAVRG